MKNKCLRLLSLLLCIVITTGALSGCESPDAELLGNYKAADSVVQADVGAMVDASFAPLLSQWYLCDITEEMLTTDYVFDGELPDRSGSAFVINRTDNTLVFGSEMLDQVYPASITKLMTALIALKECDPHETITISPEVAKLNRGSVSELNEGDVISVYNLLICLLTASANNAAVALATYLSGSEEAFAKRMNEEMARLGINDTNYVNSSGLHESNHYTTPYDMYIVYQECMKYEEFREIMEICRTEYEYYNAKGELRVREIETTNQFKLGNYPFPENITILGGKTGTTTQAGYCLMLHVQGASGMEYILGVYHAQTEEKLYTKLNDLMSTYCK